MKKKSCIFINLFLLAFSFETIAQTERICGTQEYDRYLKSISPEYTLKRAEIENRVSPASGSQSFLKISGIPAVIPVVVHIVYNTPEQNLADDQIISQIDVINEDYAAANANIVEVPSVWSHLVGSSGLQFALARKDENGNETTGITRTLTGSVSFTIGDAMKYDSTGGKNGWNSNHFLNIWVCNIASGSSQILGFAQFPGGPPKTDGIVINYKAFGRIGNNLSQYDLGRTTTHEIGHWLNLKHIWGDAGGCTTDDNISDTPKQDKATYGCPSSPHISCSNGPDGDMFQNYLDYTDDKCMMLFTTEQRNKMNSALTNDRDSILFSESYTLPVSQLANDLKISSINSPYGLICNKNFEPSVTVQNAGSSTVTNFTLQYSVDADSLHYFDWNGTLASAGNLRIDLPPLTVSEDIHTFIADITSVNGTSDQFAIDNFKTRSFLYTPEKYGCPVFPTTPTIDSLYPNPVSNTLTIKTLYKTSQKATLSIYNIFGKIIFTKDYLDSSGESLTLDVSHFAAGIYFVQVNTFDKKSGRKFVVLH